MAFTRRIAALGLAALLSACAAPCSYGPGDVLPISLAGGKPVVPVDLNGRRVPFMVDTGATGTSLFSQTAVSFRLPVDARRSTTARGIGGESRLQNALVAHLRVGQMELNNLSLPVVNITRAEGVPMAGLVGADLLRLSDVEMDFPQRRFVLHRNNGCVAGPPPWPAGYDEIPLDVLPNGLTRLRVRVDGTELWALLDSGADHSTLLLSTAQQLNVPASVLTGKPAGSVHGVGDTRLELRVQRFQTLQVGAEIMRDQPIGIMDLEGDYPFDMILGLDYIASRRMWLSYALGRLYVQRGEEGGRKGLALPPR